MITDALAGLRRHRQLSYTREPRSQRAARARGEDPGALLPGVHRVASLAKRWLLGTHQGSIDDAHLQSYLERVRVPLQPPPFPQPAGMVFYRVLELAVAHHPVRYRELVVDAVSPSLSHPCLPGGRGHPPSLERPPAGPTHGARPVLRPALVRSAG